MSHLEAVLGFFNLGVALVFLGGNHEFLAHFENAQAKIAAVERQPNGYFHLPPGIEQDEVIALFNGLDDYLRLQYQHSVSRAFDYLNRAISGEAKSADVTALRRLLATVPAS